MVIDMVLIERLQTRNFTDGLLLRPARGREPRAAVGGPGQHQQQRQLGQAAFAQGGRNPQLIGDLLEVSRR